MTDAVGAAPIDTLDRSAAVVDVMVTNYTSLCSRLLSMAR